MDSQIQEAESRKYSNDAVVLLPLSGGQWALFNNARQLLAIGSWEYLIAAAAIAPRTVRPTHEPTATIPINLEDINI